MRTVRGRGTRQTGRWPAGIRCGVQGQDCVRDMDAAVPTSEESLSMIPFKPWCAMLAMLALIGLALPTRAAVPDAERDMLLEFHARVAGGSWLTNWSGDPCADHWSGITCNVDGTHVTKVYLPLHALSGGPIPSLSPLTQLEEFNVGSNSLTGPIPDLTGLTSLRIFIVAKNKLTGTIPDISVLTARSEERRVGKECRSR